MLYIVSHCSQSVVREVSAHEYTGCCVTRNRRCILRMNNADQVKRHSQLQIFHDRIAVDLDSFLNRNNWRHAALNPSLFFLFLSSRTNGSADTPPPEKKFTVFYTLICFHNPVIIAFVTATAICIDLVPHNRCENVQVATNPSIKWLDGWMIEQWVNGRRMNGISPGFLALLAVLFRLFQTRGYEIRHKRIPNARFSTITLVSGITVTCTTKRIKIREGNNLTQPAIISSCKTTYITI